MSDTKSQTGYQHVVEQWRDELESGSEAWLDELYHQNLVKFQTWATRKYKLDEDTVLDIYQQAIISLYENVRYNKISQLNSSPSTYLFGIGKNLILKQLRENTKVDKHLLRIQEHWHFVQYDEDTFSQTFEVVKNELNKTSEPCKSIIELFYIRGMNIRAIASKLNYKSQDVVKTQKSRCMKTLKRAVEALMK